MILNIWLQKELNSIQFLTQIFHVKALNSLKPAEFWISTILLHEQSIAIRVDQDTYAEQ